MIQLILILITQVCSLRIQKNVYISNLIRTIDLTGAYVSSISKITLSNEGIVPVEKVYHAVPSTLDGQLYYTAIDQGGIEITGKLIQDLDASVKYNATIFEYTLKQPIQQGESLEFQLAEYYYNRFKPLPKLIKIEDDQFVTISDSVHIFSPYTIKSQTTIYDTERVISYSLKSATTRGNALEYGPYEDTKPYSILNTVLHIENNTPLVVFKQVTKTIEVSHWGNILIEESYSIANEGATLTGEFGRVAFNKLNNAVGRHALKSLSATLPFDTWGVYYKDEIGNISTSNAIRGKLDGQNQVKLQLRPRFAIFGGWKSNFIVGYNLPTKKYLETEGQLHILTQDFAFSIKDVIAEEYTLKVILPEAITDAQWDIPTDVLVDSGLTFSYLDFEGRPTYTFTKKLTSQHDNNPFTISYQFSSIALYRELIVLFLAFVTIFAVIIGLRRLELVTLKLKQ